MLNRDVPRWAVDLRGGAVAGFVKFESAVQEGLDV
jgi:hypothetical protein